VDGAKGVERPITVARIESDKSLLASSSRGRDVLAGPPRVTGCAFAFPCPDKSRSRGRLATEHEYLLHLPLAASYNGSTARHRATRGQDSTAARPAPTGKASIFLTRQSSPTSINRLPAKQRMPFRRNYRPLAKKESHTMTSVRAHDPMPQRAGVHGRQEAPPLARQSGRGLVLSNGGRSPPR